jgi:hypothetical protein
MNPMSLAARLRASWLALLPGLVSCQALSGLGDLEIVGDGSGAQGSGAGGGTGTGGAASCVVGWEDNAACKGNCGDPGDGISVGCGKFMDCYLEHDCLPETCSPSIDDACGINKVQSGTNGSLADAQEVVACMCGP